MPPLPPLPGTPAVLVGVVLEMVMVRVILEVAVVVVVVSSLPVPAGPVGLLPESVVGEQGTVMVFWTVDWMVVVTTEASVPVPRVMVSVLEVTTSVVVVVRPGGREVASALEVVAPGTPVLRGTLG